MNPQVIVDRFPSEKDWTLSEFSILGTKHGVGVEDEHRDTKVHGETRVDNGIYEFDLRYSPKFSKHYFRDDQGYLNATKTERFKWEHELLWVKDTPRHEFVLWHWGNTDDDTHGCYIVGKDFATFDKQKGVSASRITYTKIYPIIWQLIQKNKKELAKTYVQYRDKGILV